MRTMTIFSKFLMILCAITLVSCGGDDDKEELSLKNAISEYTYDLGIANAGGVVTTPEATVTLNELLSQYQFNPPIKSGTLNLTSGTSIRVTAFKEDIVLKNFILTVNGISQKLGDLSVEDTELYNQNNQQFVINFFNKMISQQRLTMSATFTPSRKITDEDGLKINFVLKGDYTYYK
ncbi:hypothetical protein [Massilibacteroides sp.]|uniref:hypothetical protein n=1 Tax=Massilibacteroides sp. TaxID=2034766 RepID=UPI00262A45E0|nr:hypothetical protein [Massilibacteroides sp.]MDD4516527.1 hypothetical protein [Massilibacteroides sp.]